MQIKEPIIEYIGDSPYRKGYLEKVAIDWSARKIRGTLLFQEKYSRMAKNVVWFSFDDIDVKIRICDEASS